MRWVDPWRRKRTSALDVPVDCADCGYRDAARRTTTVGVMMLLPPKLTISANPSAPIPNANPQPLFWVTGIVLGLLALWVLYVVFLGETRKAPSVAKSGDAAK